MSRAARKRHVQLTLEQARRPDGRHGGWRPGAGRPRTPGAVSHATRPDEPARYPQHVTLRIKDGVPSLARERFLKIIRATVRRSHKSRCDARGRVGANAGALIDASMGALIGASVSVKVRANAGANVGANVGASVSANVSAGAGAVRSAGPGVGGGFRIVEFNVLGNHLHLIVEADGKAALSRGVQGFCVSAARRLNPALMRTGKLFAHRYHARALRTPREVRNGLRYVLLNRKHHAAEKSFGRFWIDPWSSAAWFGGWAQPVRPDAPWKRELLEMAPPTAPPTTWLLATGWKRHGLLRFDEHPR